MGRLLNERGDETDAFATYCPQCGTTDITKGSISAQDFDDTGWFQVISFICNAPKCKHTWTNRAMLAEGGHKVQNW